MTERDHSQVETKANKVLLLKHHINAGIELIKAGATLEAYNHFAFYQRPNHDAPSIIPGMIGPIDRLLSEEDLIDSVYQVGKSSKVNPKGTSATIGGWYVNVPGVSQSFEDTPSLYKPELVKQFHYEMGLMGAEEWVHLLQYETGNSLAGQEDKEVDVAAYFDTQGLPLSADFLTRYQERTQWYITKHPDRTDELTKFAQKYGRDKELGWRSNF